MVQGLTLPWMIRRLDVGDEDEREREENKARLYAAKAALERLDELEREDWVRDDTAERMRALLGYRKRRFAARFDGGGRRRLREALAQLPAPARARSSRPSAERSSDLRRQGMIDDEVMRRVQRDLDLEDQRLEI